MGFKDFLHAAGIEADLPIAPAGAHPDVVVPLRAATTADGAQALSNLLYQQLANHVAPQVLAAIAEGVWEMVANALEHSGGDALIMGQVYKAPRGQPPDHDDRVQVVIGDTGKGIRESFLETGLHAPATDSAAIELALEYLVSSVDDRGRGQGLATTREQVVETSGRMIVRSGTAKVTLEADDSIHEVVPYLPGVIVALSLPLYPG
jgi:anti-sigma regulatory factor (Ser/Thr protein kinase)